ncbi:MULTISPECIES: 2-phosphosulfolactate phosphatase [Halobacillus]|uniref:2-phosphosulfolactate phosphatase n=1 Tax=Halobacillus TaxID=45667 RepID=UPI00041D99E7|nr:MULTISPECIES: 2-phosphosulfolactate phosphatase [Halobacillus]
MGKIEVIFKKEDIQPEKLTGKTAVVFDVLFATSTMTAAIADGALSVLPVYSPELARKTAEAFDQPFLLAGEDQGRTIEGFYPPLRNQLKKFVAGKHLILTTTNGTVALHKAQKAADLYASSLLNNPSTARHLNESHSGETIVIICSGSSGLFTMEDFYGAGSLVHHMQQDGNWELSDGALTSLHFYKGGGEARELLRSCRIGNWLMKHGLDPAEIDFAAQEGVVEAVLAYDKITGQVKEGHYASS